MKRSVVLLLLFSFLAMRPMAQTSNLVFKHFTRANGLPVDEVTYLAQDSTGFIWIGSKEGLFRFDGFNFKSFYHSPGNSGTIPNNYITKILVDNEGLIWVGTLGGAAIMKNNGQILKVLNSETESIFSKEAAAIHDLLAEGNHIWISTAGGLYSLQKNGQAISAVRKHDLKKDFQYETNQFGPLIVDQSKRLWISTLHGVVIYDPNKKELLHAGNNPQSLKILKERHAFRSLWMDESHSSVVYSTWQPAVKVFNIVQNTVSDLYSPKGPGNPEYRNLISHYLKDAQGKLWMATGMGVKTRDQRGVEQTIENRSGNGYSIVSNQITCLLEDKEGSIWVATDKGISVAQPYRQSITNLSSNSVGQSPLANVLVNAIIPVDENTVLIGTDVGVFRTDSNFNVLEHYSFGTNNYDNIWKFYLHGNHIYISAQKGTLLYNVQTRKLEKLLHPPFDKHFPLSSIIAGKDGTIWMSQYRDNFLQYHPENKKFKVFNLTEMGEEPAVLHLAADNEKNVWVLSTSTGLLKFDEKTGKFTERLVVKKQDGLIETHILFLEDLGDELLIGYVSKGISLYHKKNKTYRHYSRSDGLISNSVTSALQTDKNTVWITTRNGLSRFDRATNTFMNYSYANGILQNDFNCIQKLPGGKLAAGGINGLVHFYPSNLKATPKIEPPIITALTVYGTDLPIDSFSNENPLHISPDENYFSVEYISLQYANNQQIEYAYKLDGFDKNWITAGQRRFASYSNVNGGNYKLRVRSRVQGGEWVENNFLLPVIVHTYFYKKTWFLLAVVIAFLAIAYGIFRYRLHQILRLQKVRSSISSDLHDEVGATLTSISIFSEMAKQAVPPGSKAEPFLQRIGDRSRDSIEKMSDIIWSINPENDSLQEMLIRMKTFVNEVVEGKDIAVTWEENELVARLKLDMSQRKNLYLLFKEAIINAVKYADARNISVQLTAYHKLVSLRISDDGKGFNFDTVRAGNGIKNIRQRAILLNGKATIDPVIGKGTTVQVAFKS